MITTEVDERVALLSKSNKPEEGKGGGLTRSEGVLGVININVGLALLGLPYAFKTTGMYQSFHLLFITTVWSALCSYYLMECFHHPKVKRANIRDYTNLGKLLLNKPGYLITSIAEIGWCFAASCAIFLNVVKNAMTFTPLPMFVIYMICILLALPTIMARNFSEINFLSILGSATPFALITCLILIAMFATPQAQPEPTGSISLGAGIFILSYTSSPAYPQIFHNLARKKDSTQIVLQSFFLMFFINCVMGACGLYIYGKSTSIIIAENLKIWPGSVAFYGMTLLLWLTLFCMIAPINLLVCQSFRNVIDYPQNPRAFQFSVFFLTVIVSYPFQSLLAPAEAFIGNCFGIIITFILPTLFHYILYHNELSIWSKILHWVSLICGTTCCIVFTAQLFL